VIKKFCAGAVSLIVFGVIGSPKAHAYLDPGTGSFILQMLIAGAVGAAMAIKAFWGNIVMFFNRQRPPQGKKEKKQ